MGTPSSSSDRDPLERLAAEFLDRRRRGEDPSPSDYARRYPQWAEQILEFFPALEVLEGLKPGPATTPPRSRAGPGALGHMRSSRSSSGLTASHPSPPARAEGPAGH
jgi:hypothetical protein